MGLKEDILLLWNSGKTRSAIVMELGCSLSTVHKYCKGLRKEDNEKQQLCICLRMDGYYIDEIMKITNLARSTVVQYTSGIDGAKRPTTGVKYKVPKVKVMKTIKKKKTSQIEQRSVLGKGVVSGVYELPSVKREETGRRITVRYKGLSVIQVAEIFVSGDMTDDEARQRWCNRNGIVLA